MATESIAPTNVVDAPEKTFLGLRRFNLIMGFLHLIQGIFMIVVSNDTTYPIYTNYLNFDTTTFSLSPNSQLFYEVPFGPAVAMFFSTLLFLLYFTLFTGDGGQTLGKMFLGIRVQRMDGSPVGYRCALLRTIGYIVSVFFGTFLGFLWALWDRNNQTWHDKIAGTRVIKI